MESPQSPFAGLIAWFREIDRAREGNSATGRSLVAQLAMRDLRGELRRRQAPASRSAKYRALNRERLGIAD